MKRFLLITIAAIFCSSATVCAQFNTVTQTKVHRKAAPKTTQSTTPERLPPCSPHQRRDSLAFAPLQIQAKQTGCHTVFISPLRHISVTSPFGCRRDPFTKRKALHNGPDLRTNYEPTCTMMHGEVIRVDKNRRSGLYITLRHGNFIVNYCHLFQTPVTKGTHVRPGIIIALTDNSGCSTGFHLHPILKDTKKGRVIGPSVLLNLIEHPL